MYFSDLRTKKQIAILGYALEGQSTYRFLRAQGIPSETITILDKKTDITLPDGVNSQLGERYLDNLDRFDCIWRTPGITNTIIEQYTGQDPGLLPLVSQTEFFLNNYTGKIIGVTGTKGKSTISTVAYLTLQQAGKHVLLAGNVGKPVLDLIDRDNIPDYVVYELSSFMIESVFMNRQGRKIDIAIFNTLYSTHTKEHGGYIPYAQAKYLLCEHSDRTYFGYQAVQELMKLFPELVLPDNHTIYGKWGTRTRKDGQFLRLKEHIGDDSGMLLVGEHNRYNMCALVALCDDLDIPFTALQHVLHSFAGLEHRLENVGVYGGIQWINDAIATTPEATCAAIESFGNSIDTLFYGGILGEYNHQLVAEKIKKYKISNLVLFPDTGEVLFSLLDTSIQATLNVYHTRSMEEAVQRAAQHTKKNHIALLSCGSPSFSVWSGFVEKGRLFKEAVCHLS